MQMTKCQLKEKITESLDLIKKVLDADDKEVMREWHLPKSVLISMEARVIDNIIGEWDWAPD